MAVVEISVTPLGTAGTGVSAYVAGALRLARQSGLKHRLTPMGTIVVGEVDALFARGATRVATLIKIDDRRDAGAHAVAGRVVAVEEPLR